MRVRGKVPPRYDLFKCRGFVPVIPGAALAAFKERDNKGNRQGAQCLSPRGWSWRSGKPLAKLPFGAAHACICPNFLCFPSF